MQLVQIGEEPKGISILDMFRKMAEREAEMIREARERAVQRESSGKTKVSRRTT